MAGVTFDFHRRYHYLALTWFACSGFLTAWWWWWWWWSKLNITNNFTVV
jgi:hypothetical protein